MDTEMGIACSPPTRTGRKFGLKNRTFAGDVWFRFQEKTNGYRRLCDHYIACCVLPYCGTVVYEIQLFQTRTLEVVNIPPLYEGV